MAAQHCPNCSIREMVQTMVVSIALAFSMCVGTEEFCSNWEMERKVISRAGISWPCVHRV